MAETSLTEPRSSELRVATVRGKASGHRVVVVNAQGEEVASMASSFDRSLAAQFAAAPELVEVARVVATIPARDCPWGCAGGHDADCPSTRAAAIVAKAVTT